MRIHVDLDKCTGCRTCEVICYFYKDHKINPRKARVEVIRVDRAGLDIPIICAQCVTPKCAEACPTEAITKDDSGIIRVTEDRCTGCGICADACVIGAIRIDPDTKKPLICDLCNGKPKCVEWCPTKALDFDPTTGKTSQKWRYVLAQARINAEKWKLPEETLEYIRRKADMP